jgi:hypothetical protein
MAVENTNNPGESDPLLPSPSDAPRPLDPADRINPDDILDLNYREVPPHLQSAKASSKYRLAQYFERRDVWARSRAVQLARPLNQDSSTLNSRGADLTSSNRSKH